MRILQLAFFWSLSTALVLVMQVATSHAQNQLQLEEVVVTASKRESSLQDVAVAVSAVTEQSLKDALLDNTQDLATLVPSLNLQKGGNPRSSSFNIRGIGTQSFSSGAEPSVSTVVDGVVMGRSGMAFMQMLDLKRVEVLRGPQGTLFGKNASGGVVHIISKDPSPEFEGELRTTIIEDDEYRFGFSISDSPTDTFGYRLTGTATDNNGFIKNIYNGRESETTEDRTLRAKLQWNPTDTLDIKWSSDTGKLDQDCCIAPVRSIDPWEGATTGQLQTQQEILLEILPVVPSDTANIVNLNTVGKVEVESSGHALEMNWDIGDYTLTSITALRQWEQTSFGDIDGRPTTGLVVQGGFSDQEQFTQEFRLTSPADGFMSYVAGLYYFDQDLIREFSRTLFPNVPALAGTAESQGVVNSLNYAAFGELTFNISDTVRFIAGLRYTYDELEYEFSRTQGGNFQPEIPLHSDDLSEDDVSGKLALQWDFSDDAMVYVSYAQGYKGPAYNITAGSTLANTVPIDPEISDAWELGLKSSWFDNRLRVNVALFRAEYEDFQAQNVEAVLVLDDNGNTQDADGNGVADTAFSFVLNNVGEVVTQGLEVDFSGLLTENLSITGGFAFIDAEIENYPGGPCSFTQEVRGVGFRGQTTCARPEDPTQPRQQDLSGGELPNSPDWKFTLGANYTIPLDDASFDIILKGSYRIQDDVQYGLQQEEQTIQESYDVLDFSLVFQDKDDRYTATAFVKNVLDEFYVTSIAGQNENIILNGYQHRVPKTANRTFGFEFRYKW